MSKDDKEVSNEDRLLSRISIKIKEKGIKVAKLVHLCEGVDKNKDGIIHIDDFEEVIKEAFGFQTLTRREVNFLVASCLVSKKSQSIEYERLYNVFGAKSVKHTEDVEVWRDPETEESSKSAPGTIGTASSLFSYMFLDNIVDKENGFTRRLVQQK